MRAGETVMMRASDGVGVVGRPAPSDGLYYSDGDGGVDFIPADQALPYLRELQRLQRERKSR